MRSIVLHKLRRLGGVTALDLAVTLAIAAVIIALAVPALQDMAMNQRMRAALAALHSDLALARATAIHRSARVVVCPAAGAEQCANQPLWQAGWLVFEDRNDDREYQAVEPLLRRGNATPLLSITASVHRMRLRFFGNGSAPGSNAAITFCDRRGAEAARQLVLSASGRILRRSPGDAGTLNCPP